MPNTPVFGWDTPALGEPADVPADLLQLATEIEEDLKVLEPKFLKTAGAGDSGKLLIVDGTGAAAFVAASGDVTNGPAGVFTIGAEKVTSAKIALLAITEALLAGEAVGSAKIKNLAVTAAKLAAEAVETAKLQNLAVTAAKLAAEAVETGKIKNLAVTEAKIAELAIGTSRLAASAVTEEKIADKAVTSRKMKPTYAYSTGGAEPITSAAEVQILEFTNIVVSVESHLRLWVQLNRSSGGGNGQIDLFTKLNAEGSIIQATTRSGNTQEETHGPYICRYVLAPGTHTIKVLAKTKSENAALTSPKTRGWYDLMSV